MPLASSELLVLRRIGLRDTSLMLNCLTLEFGKLSLVARAASKPGSKLAEALQYFTVAEIQFYYREKRAADYISKAEVIETFANIPGDATRFGYGAAGLEFANLYLPEEEVNREAYELLKRYLRIVDHGKLSDLQRELLHFWLHLTILAGYEPQLDQCLCGKPIIGPQVAISPAQGCVICKSCCETTTGFLQIQMGTLQVLRRLAATDIQALGKVTLTETQVEEIKKLLTAMTEFHVGRRATLRSFDYLRKLSSSETFGGPSGEKDT
jgi:DNA repair protein RecO (recombination protein O)